MNPDEKVEFSFRFYDCLTETWADLDEIAACAAESIEAFHNTRQKLQLELEEARDNDPLWGIFA